MLLEPVSWNGHNINDATNYVAWIPAGGMDDIKISLQWSERARTWAELAGKSLSGSTVVLAIECKGTYHSQEQTLRYWFGFDDWDLHTLVYKDTADSNRLYEVQGFTASRLQQADNGGAVFYVSIALQVPLLKTSTPITGSWNITATNQTTVLANGGNRITKPKLTLTPTNAKNGSYAYKYFVRAYNAAALSLKNYMLNLTGSGLNTSTLVADATISNQVNKVGGITAGDLTIPVDTPLGGGLNTAGGMCYCGTEQIKYTGIAAGSMTVYDDGAGVTGRGWGGTAAAIHADNAVMKQSYVMANGNDMRLIANSDEQDIWLDGMNGANTEAWARISFPAKVEMTLGVAIANSGTITKIEFRDNAVNRARIKRLPARGTFLIDSEMFSYSAVNRNQVFVTVTRRTEYGSSIAAHAVGATCRFIPNVLWLVTGNSLEEAPETDDNYKPILTLAGSTNTSWDFDEFMDRYRKRGGWQPALTQYSGSESDYYTGSHEDDADPATEMGMAIRAYQVQNLWMAGNAMATWQFYHPGGITHIAAASGYKYMQMASWPTAVIQKSNDGEKWVTVSTIAKPTAAATWQAWSVGSTALGGTYKYVRFMFKGPVAAALNNKSILEVTDVTLTLASANVPQLSLGARQDNYHVDARVTNVTTGDYFTVKGPLAVGESVVIDTEAQTIKTSDGSKLKIVFSSRRDGWLDMLPGNNTIKYTEAGVAAMTFAYEYDQVATL